MRCGVVVAGFSGACRAQQASVCATDFVFLYAIWQLVVTADSAAPLQSRCGFPADFAFPKLRVRSKADGIFAILKRADLGMAGRGT